MVAEMGGRGNGYVVRAVEGEERKAGSVTLTQERNVIPVASDYRITPSSTCPTWREYTPSQIPM